MSFSLSEVVPWGRSLKEYIDMFSLTQDNLKQPILGCGDGPASFNAELTSKGGRVISVDPIYQFTSVEIQKRISDTYETVLKQLEENRSDFVWDTIPSIENLGEIRQEAMMRFIEDYSQHAAKTRYISGKLPSLPFEDNHFPLALCSHFLFLYSGHFNERFHIESIQELLRVSGEVRIFPLVELNSHVSRHIDAVTTHFSKSGYTTSTEKVTYEFQKNGNTMLRITQ